MRLYGIDAPDDGQAYGAEATSFLKNKIGHETVIMEKVTTDYFDRVVALVKHRVAVVNEML